MEEEIKKILRRTDLVDTKAKEICQLFEAECHKRVEGIYKDITVMLGELESLAIEAGNSLIARGINKAVEILRQALKEQGIT